MSGLVEKDILAALDAITASGDTQSLIAADRVQGLVLRDGNIGFSIEVDGLAPETLEGLKAQAEQAIKNLSGVVSVTCILTAHRAAQKKAPHNSASTEIPAIFKRIKTCLLYTSPSPRDMRRSRMPSSA